MSTQRLPLYADAGAVRAVMVPSREDSDADHVLRPLYPNSTQRLHRWVLKCLNSRRGSVDTRACDLFRHTRVAAQLMEVVADPQESISACIALRNMARNIKVVVCPFVRDIVINRLTLRHWHTASRSLFGPVAPLAQMLVNKYSATLKLDEIVRSDTLSLGVVTGILSDLEFVDFVRYLWLLQWAYADGMPQTFGVACLELSDVYSYTLHCLCWRQAVRVTPSLTLPFRLQSFEETKRRLSLRDIYALDVHALDHADFDSLLYPCRPLRFGDLPLGNAVEESFYTKFNVHPLAHVMRKSLPLNSQIRIYGAVFGKRMQTHASVRQAVLDMFTHVMLHDKTPRAFVHVRALLHALHRITSPGLTHASKVPASWAFYMKLMGPTSSSPSSGQIYYSIVRYVIMRRISHIPALRLVCEQLFNYEEFRHSVNLSLHLTHAMLYILLDRTSLADEADLATQLHTVCQRLQRTREAHTKEYNFKRCYDTIFTVLASKSIIANVAVRSEHELAIARLLLLHQPAGCMPESLLVSHGPRYGLAFPRHFMDVLCHAIHKRANGANTKPLIAALQASDEVSFAALVAYARMWRLWSAVQCYPTYIAAATSQIDALLTKHPDGRIPERECCVWVCNACHAVRTACYGDVQTIAHACVDFSQDRVVLMCAERSHEPTALVRVCIVGRVLVGSDTVAFMCAAPGCARICVRPVYSVPSLANGGFICDRHGASMPCTKRPHIKILKTCCLCRASNDLIYVHLPPNVLVLCSRHLTEPVRRVLSTRVLERRETVNPRCVKKGCCVCNDGRSTCTGAINVATLYAWLQETRSDPLPINANNNTHKRKRSAI